MLLECCANLHCQACAEGCPPAASNESTCDICLSICQVAFAIMQLKCARREYILKSSCRPATYQIHTGSETAKGYLRGSWRPCSVCTGSSLSCPRNDASRVCSTVTSVSVSGWVQGFNFRAVVSAFPDWEKELLCNDRPVQVRPNRFWKDLHNAGFLRAWRTWPRSEDATFTSHVTMCTGEP